MKEEPSFLAKTWLPYATSVGAFFFQVITLIPAIHFFGAPYGSAHFMKFDHPVLIGLYCVPLVALLGLTSCAHLRKAGKHDAAAMGFVLNVLYLGGFGFLTFAAFGFFL